MIGEEGAGVIVVINKPRPDAFTAAVQPQGGRRTAADMEELRDYGVGAKILTELGVAGHGAADQHAPHAGRRSTAMACRSSASAPIDRANRGGRRPDGATS